MTIATEPLRAARAAPRLRLPGPFAVAVALVLAAVVAWAALDRFLDREEGHHALRICDKSRRLAAAPDAASFLKEATVVRATDAKPWYGPVYYLAMAALWSPHRAFQASAFALNLFALLVQAVLCGRVAFRLAERCGADPGKARDVARLLALTVPGSLFWLHFVNPSTLASSLACATMAAVLETDGFSDSRKNLAAGFLATLSTLTKVNSPALWGPVVVWELIRAVRRRPFPTRRLIFFVAPPLLVLVPFVLANRAALVSASRLSFDVWGWKDPSIAIAVPFHMLIQAASPIHLPLALAGIAILLATRGRTAFATTIAAVLAFAGQVGLFAISGGIGTTRDAAPYAFVLLALAGVGFGCLPVRLLRGVRWALAGFLLPFFALNYFDLPEWGTEGHRTAWLLRQRFDGATWGLRLEPWPDLLKLAEESLARAERLRRPVTLPAWVGWLNNEEVPPTLFDSIAIGPENLTARRCLLGQTTVTNQRLTPYPVSCAPFVLATSSADLFVVAADSRAGFDAAASDWKEKRGALVRDSQLLDELRVRDTVLLQVRRPSLPIEDATAARSALSACGGDPLATAVKTVLDAAVSRDELAAAVRTLRAIRAGPIEPLRLVHGEGAFLAGFLQGAERTLETRDEFGADRAYAAPPWTAPASARALERHEVAGRLEITDLPSDARAGQVIQVRVTAVNLGSSTWPSARSLISPNRAVRLALEIVALHAAPAATGNSRVELPWNLGPGEGVELGVQLRAPESPAHYRVRAELLQENTAWWRDFGVAPVEREISVR